VTVVVTGAAGHIGGTLVRALLAQGRPTRALVHHDRRALEELDVETTQGDVRDPASLRRAFAGAEVVYHAAAHISLRMDEWPLLEAINVTGTQNVVEACLACGVRRLVHFSSIHALEQEPLDVPVDEERPLVESARHPPYDRSKAAAERCVREGIARGLDAVILYPTGIIGPYDFRPSHLGGVVLSICHGKLPALVTGGFDWVDVRDVVAGAMRAEERAPPGASYLLSGHWVSARDLASAVSELTGARAPRLTVPIWAARLGIPFVVGLARLNKGEPLYTRVALGALHSNRRISHERAARDLDYRPRPFRDTLIDTLQWFRGAGTLDRPLAANSPEAQ
jgi:dihydroflavonol-4-reductase